MKLINTYKQRDITWFNYKHLFKLKGKLSAHRDYSELELESWVKNPHISVSIRKPYEDN